MSKLSVLSLSGGMDSTSLLLHLLAKNHTVHAITFDYAQRHKIEIIKAKENISYLFSKGYKVTHEIIDITSCSKLLSSSLTNINEEIPEGFYKEKNMLSTVVPNRNAIFSSILYGYALSISSNTSQNVTLSLGVHAGDHAIYPDCRIEFYDKIMDAYKTGNWNSEKISIYIPYIDLDKAEILKDALVSTTKLKIHFNTVFKNTITSYEPNSNGISNGKTGSDIERILAFNELGLKDPLEYKTGWKEVLEYAKKIQQKHEKFKSI